MNSPHPLLSSLSSPRTIFNPPSSPPPPPSLSPLSDGPCSVEARDGRNCGRPRPAPDTNPQRESQSTVSLAAIVDQSRIFWARTGRRRGAPVPAGEPDSAGQPSRLETPLVAGNPQGSRRPGASWWRRWLGCESRRRQHFPVDRSVFMRRRRGVNIFVGCCGEGYFTTSR